MRRNPPRTLSISVIGFAAIALTGLASPVVHAAGQSFDCVIEPSVVVEVGGPLPGLLDQVLVKRGDRVKRGEIIARLDSRVEKATAKLLGEQASNRAEIDAQRARANLAINRASRAQQLMESNATSKDKLEESMAQMEIAKRDLAMAEMRRRIAQLELDRARTVVDQRSIRSPIDGVVIARNLHGGEYLNQEGKVATIAQIDPLNVEVFLPVAYYDKIALGMEAMVSPAPPLTGTYKGKVTVVDQVFDAASSTFGARVSLPNPDLKLPAGQRCRVEFSNLAN